ncbi:hypothetical protein B6U91_00645 [Candidatus Pacearchaeota archaeon ex4484_71]|nr:MAG: hypothetical protein B6U91_00645 [Candidatus Pacearchaeota archaeon ex4484_71]
MGGTSYRKFFTQEGTLFYMGKDAKSNDLLVGKFKGKENVILHTVPPGSPFCVLDSKNPSKKEIREVAIACAAKSKYWRDNKKSVKVHIFSGKDVKKTKIMKEGTWSVGGKTKTIKARKREIKKWLLLNKSS